MDCLFGLHGSAACLMLLFFFGGAVAEVGAAAAAGSRDFPIFNVLDFGAVGDGKTDNSKAFSAAWGAACASEGSAARMVIPQGRFLLRPVTFAGPCNGSVLLRVRGTVLAPADLGAFDMALRTDWIAFNYIDGMLISGRGRFDGQGDSAWPLNDCAKNRCMRLPTSISFNFVTNSVVRKISSVNSKQCHIHVFACKNLRLEGITITAPGDSPNTDGIHIGDSSDIQIRDAAIGTGDDCISIGPGNRNLGISGVSCGPGHGISVGSLGGSPGDRDVANLVVANCSFAGTQNGVRIKTWQAPYSLTASNITFEDISMNGVSNPIVIDQEYCPDNRCSRTCPSRVQISDVRFKNIRGTSASEVAIKLLCSESFPCQNVELIDIDLVCNIKGEVATSACSNVRGVSIGPVVPPSCI